MPLNALSPDPMRPVLHLDTFGRVAGRLVRPGAPADRVPTGPDAVPVLATGKPLALLIYLACAPEQAASREHLASLLWSSEDPAHARQSLRQLILRLRQQLGSDVLEATRDLIRLVVPCEIDRAHFLRAVAAGDLVAATQAYRGAFLPDLSFPGGREFDDWVAIERLSLSRQFQLTGQRLVRQWLDVARPRDALAVARRLRDDAPHEESAWRPLLEAALAMDDPITAAVEATALERMLAEFDTDPSPAMRALLARCHNAPLPQAPASARLVAELVGREQEFAAILSRWDGVRRQRRGRMTLLEGAAGYGKTRLLTDIARRLSAGGARVVSIAASEGDATAPWTALARVAQGLATLPGARGVAPESARLLVALHPALSSVFAVTPAGDSEPGETGGDEAVRVRGLAVADLLGAVSDERAVALLLDDLHWWDARSLDALGVIGTTVASQAVLLVAASRRSDVVRAASAHADIMSVRPLTLDALEALLASLAVPISGAWAREVADALESGSGGNPLLALEALEGAMARGLLMVHDGSWRTEDTPMLLHTLRRGDALQARVQALDAEERWVVLLLAAAAQPLTAQLLLAASAREAPVRDAVERLRRTGIVVPVATGVRVAHDLLAARVLEQTEPPLRRQAHLALGRALEARADTLAGVRRALSHFLRALALDEAATLVSAHWSRTGGVRRWRRVDALLDALFDGLPADDARAEGQTSHRGGVRARLPRRLRLAHWRAPAAAAAMVVLLALLSLWRTTPDRQPTLLLGLGSGDSVRLVALSIDTTGRMDRRPLSPSTGRLLATFGSRGAFSGFPRNGPGDAGIVLHRFSEDSGGFDVYRLETSGTLTRLTATPGDDIDPEWSPDGRFIVYQSAQWSVADEAHADLALLDLGTGAVHRLTDGPHRDRQPRWSPDGLRIAFFRRVAGVMPPDSVSAICWTTLRGDPPRCHRSRIDAGASLHGWMDGTRVIVSDIRTGRQVWQHDVDSGAETPVAAPAFGVGDVSPREGWAFGWRDAYDKEAMVGTLDGTRWQPLAMGRDTIEFAAWATPVRDSGVVQSITWPQASAQQPVGVALSPFLLGQSRDGARVPLPAGVVRWSSAAPFVQLDDGGQSFRAVRAGAAVLLADVGGWRRDTFTVRFAEAPAVSLLDERWRDTTLAAWRRYGEPLVAVRSTDDGPALQVAGDGTFVSGAVSDSGWFAADGLAADFVVSTPVMRDVWQRLHLLLVTDPRVVIGGVGGAPMCAWRYPAREETGAHRRAGLLLRVDSASFAPPPVARGDRRWYRVRLQWFPDGRCGVAVDGRVVARGGYGAPPAGRVHVAIEGQSVGTDVQVQSVRVWRGIPAGVDWSPVPADAAADVSVRRVRRPLGSRAGTRTLVGVQ